MYPMHMMESRIPSLDGYGNLYSKAETGKFSSDIAKKYPDYCRTIKVQDSHGGMKELVFPKALDLDRPKRARTTFSTEQLCQLEQEFQRNQYLVGKERTQLARQLRLSETQVKVWFQNRRTKYKRDRSREADVIDSKSESAAACNILRLLQNQVPPIPCNSYLPPYHYGNSHGCTSNGFFSDSQHLKEL